MDHECTSRYTRRNLPLAPDGLNKHASLCLPEGRGFTGCGKILPCCYPESAAIGRPPVSDVMHAESMLEANGNAPLVIVGVTPPSAQPKSRKRAKDGLGRFEGCRAGHRGRFPPRATSEGVDRFPPLRFPARLANRFIRLIHSERLSSLLAFRQFQGISVDREFPLQFPVRPVTYAQPLLNATSGRVFSRGDFQGLRKDRIYTTKNPIREF